MTVLLVVSSLLALKFFSKTGTTLPPDIIKKVKQLFPNPEESDKVLKILRPIKEEGLNVGADQLIRSILIIAEGDMEKIKKIIDSHYYGDPRDVIMEAMQKDGNNNDHGMTPFQF